MFIGLAFFGVDYAIISLLHFAIMSDQKPHFDFNALLRDLHTEYARQFEALFFINRNGTLRCRNGDIPLINRFFDDFQEHFRENGFILNHFHLDPVGFGDIRTVMDNKAALLRLYGLAFQLYIKSCAFLRRQPNAQYFDAVLVELEITGLDDEGKKDDNTSNSSTSKQ